MSEHLYEILWDDSTSWTWPCLVVNINDTCDEAKNEYYNQRIHHKVEVRYFNTREEELYIIFI